MNDEERRKLYHVCMDTIIALEIEKIKLDNAIFVYMQAMQRYDSTVNLYLNDIIALLEKYVEKK